MWQLLNPEIRKARLNFPASGWGKTAVTQLWDSNTQIINAIEHVNWGGPDLQFQICEVCGCVGCQSEGWISVRRTDSLAIILPAFQSIQKAGRDLTEKYLPPLYLWKKGAIFIEEHFYTDHLYKISGFSAFNELMQLTSWEMAKLFQWESSHRVLGNIEREPRLPTDIVIASSEGSFIEQTRYLNLLIENLLSSDCAAKLRRKTEQDQVVSMYLDMAGFPRWEALSFCEENYFLYLKPGYIIEY